MRSWGLGFGAGGLRFRDWGLGIRDEGWGLGFIEIIWFRNGNLGLPRPQGLLRKWTVFPILRSLPQTLNPEPQLGIVHLLWEIAYCI